MAQYNVTFACGHSLTKQLYGKETQRQSYISWAAKHGSCPDCAKADKMAACEAVEAEHGLPALSGSEKQVAWARSIRSEIIVKVLEQIEKMRARAVEQDKVEMFEGRSAAMLQVIAGQAAARYWIDNKDKPAQTILQDAYKATA